MLVLKYRMVEYGHPAPLRAAGVLSEMHVYAQGAHGASRDRQYGTTALWPQSAEEWLRTNGWLTK